MTLIQRSRERAAKSHRPTDYFSLPFHQLEVFADVAFLAPSETREMSDKNLEFINSSRSLFAFLSMHIFLAALALLTISVYRKVNFSFSFQMLRERCLRRFRKWDKVLHVCFMMIKQTIEIFFLCSMLSQLRNCRFFPLSDRV